MDSPAQSNQDKQPSCPILNNVQEIYQSYLSDALHLENHCPQTSKDHKNDGKGLVYQHEDQNPNPEVFSSFKRLSTQDLQSILLQQNQDFLNPDQTKKGQMLKKNMLAIQDLLLTYEPGGIGLDFIKQLNLFLSGLDLKTKQKQINERQTLCLQIGVPAYEARNTQYQKSLNLRIDNMKESQHNIDITCKNLKREFLQKFSEIQELYAFRDQDDESYGQMILLSDQLKEQLKEQKKKIRIFTDLIEEKSRYIFNKNRGLVKFFQEKYILENYLGFVREVLTDGEMTSEREAFFTDTQATIDGLFQGTELSIQIFQQIHFQNFRNLIFYKNLFSQNPEYCNPNSNFLQQSKQFYREFIWFYFKLMGHSLFDDSKDKSNQSEQNILTSTQQEECRSQKQQDNNQEVLQENNQESQDQNQEIQIEKEENQPQEQVLGNQKQKQDGDVEVNEIIEWVDLEIEEYKNSYFLNQDCQINSILNQCLDFLILNPHNLAIFISSAFLNRTQLMAIYEIMFKGNSLTKIPEYSELQARLGLVLELFNEFKEFQRANVKKEVVDQLNGLIQNHNEQLENEIQFKIDSIDHFLQSGIVLSEEIPDPDQSNQNKALQSKSWPLSILQGPNTLRQRFPRFLCVIKITILLTVLDSTLRQTSDKIPIEDAVMLLKYNIAEASIAKGVITGIIIIELFSALLSLLIEIPISLSKTQIAHVFQEQALSSFNFLVYYICLRGARAMYLLAFKNPFEFFVEVGILVSLSLIEQKTIFTVKPLEKELQGGYNGNVINNLSGSMEAKQNRLKDLKKNNELIMGYWLFSILLYVFFYILYIPLDHKIFNLRTSNSIFIVLTYLIAILSVVLIFSRQGIIYLEVFLQGKYLEKRKLLSLAMLNLSRMLVPIYCLFGTLKFDKINSIFSFFMCLTYTIVISFVFGYNQFKAYNNLMRIQNVWRIIQRIRDYDPRKSHQTNLVLFLSQYLQKIEILIVWAIYEPQETILKHMKAIDSKIKCYESQLQTVYQKFREVIETIQLLRGQRIQLEALKQKLLLLVEKWPRGVPKLDLQENAAFLNNQMDSVYQRAVQQFEFLKKQEQINKKIEKAALVFSTVNDQLQVLAEQALDQTEQGQEQTNKQKLVDYYTEYTKQQAHYEDNKAENQNQDGLFNATNYFILEHYQMQLVSQITQQQAKFRESIIKLYKDGSKGNQNSTKMNFIANMQTFQEIKIDEIVKQLQISYSLGMSTEDGLNDQEITNQECLMDNEDDINRKLFEFYSKYMSMNQIQDQAAMDQFQNTFESQNPGFSGKLFVQKENSEKEESKLEICARELKRLQSEMPELIEAQIFSEQNGTAQSAEMVILVDELRREKLPEMDSCCICMYTDLDVNVITPCSHAFHYNCIFPWIIIYNTTCPVCRSDMRN